MSKVHRCGRGCHEAKHDKCVCWCGGTFHGIKGKENRELMKDIISERFPEARLDDKGYYMVQEDDQLKLF